MLRELLEALMGKRSKKKRKNKKRRQFQDPDQRVAPQDKRDDPAWRIADRMAKASREAAERHQGGAQ